MKLNQSKKKIIPHIPNEHDILKNFETSELILLQIGEGVHWARDIH